MRLHLLAATLLCAACPSCDDGGPEPAEAVAAARDEADAGDDGGPEPLPAPALAEAVREETDASDPADAPGAPAVTIVRREGQVEPQEGDDAPTPSPEDRWMKCEQYDVPFQGKTLRSLRIGKPGGREVLLLHGARFDCRTWLELGTLELLARNGCRAMAIDLPGYGKSASIEAETAGFLHRILPYLDLKKPVVVFPSMSGSFAFPLAIDHPEELAGLVPVAPVGIDDFASKLQAVKLPALIFWGERDAVVPLAKGRKLESLLAGSKLIVLPDAEHPCYLDQPERFHALLLEFLAVPGGSGR